MRNKDAEQTVRQILEVSTKLFLEQGYEKTTIQDILNELKMSKGAIYYHFSSKEEILKVIINHRSSYAKELINNLIEKVKADNAKDKIKKIITEIILDKTNHSIDIILSSQIKNPQFVVSGIQSCVLDDAQVISKLFEDGVEDGSIKTQYPLESAEMFMFLLNIWINPVIFCRNIEQTEQRLRFLSHSMKQIGVDVMSDEMINQVIESYQNMNAF